MIGKSYRPNIDLLSSLWARNLIVAVMFTLVDVYFILKMCRDAPRKLSIQITLH